MGWGMPLARRGRLCAVLLALVLVGACAPAAWGQTTYYVDGDTGSDGSTGDTWASAFATLTKALDAATGSDPIWIAQGTYYPDEGPGVTDDDCSASLTVTGDQDGLEIYGGFENGDAFTDRSPADHPVILSGDVNGDGSAPFNSYHIVLMDGGTGIGSDIDANITGATVLSGVTITGGRANGTGFDIEGGGLYCDGSGSGNACSPTLTYVTFIGNQAQYKGGAIHNDGTSSPTITNVTFVGNTAANNGGALYNYGAFGGTSIPAVTNTILWGNAATNGGNEIYNLDATATVAHSLIEGGANGEGVAGEANTDAGNNLVADPLFARPGDPDGPDGTFATADDGLRRTEGSPALNAGDSTALSASTDITGAVRVQGPTVDLGAYEGTDGVIPVEQTRLTATPDAGGALLEWTTAAETENAGFEIERQNVGEENASSDAASGDAAGSDWTTVGFVEGAAPRPRRRPTASGRRPCRWARTASAPPSGSPSCTNCVCTNCVCTDGLCTNYRALIPSPTHAQRAVTRIPSVSVSPGCVMTRVPAATPSVI